MIDRFQGAQGESDLRWLLKEQVLLLGIDVAADELAPIVKEGVAELPTGKQVYVEGETYRRTLYLILGGKIDLYRQGTLMASLERGQFFGEFPLLDSTARYAVTVQVAENACIAPIEWEAFACLADKYPRIWRNMASELALRLRGNRSSAVAFMQLEDPKSLQEAVVRVAWALPKTARAVLAVLVVLGIAAYFLWSSLPEATKSKLAGYQPHSASGASASAK